MRRDERWLVARIGYVETLRMLLGAELLRQAEAFRQDWLSFDVVELDASLAERAATMAAEERLHSLDAIHLAAALSLPVPDLVLATWDRKLHAAAARRGLSVLPASL